MITVQLNSDAFEPETFEYENVEDALAGVARLVKTCQEEYEKDKIVRAISIIVGEEEPEGFFP